MSESASSPGLGDLLGLFGGANPFGGISKSIAQFQRGVTQFLDTVENFNGTMAQLNEIAARVNGLLDDVEPPIRALMPQITRTLMAADTMVEQLSAPIERVAPALTLLADTLSSPQLTALPRELAEFMSTLGDLARRMQPLGQLAEAAGGMFGLRPLAALRAGSGRPPAPAPPPPPAPAAKKPAVKKPAAKQAPAKKAVAKKTPARKTPAPRK